MTQPESMPNSASAEAVVRKLENEIQRANSSEGPARTHTPPTHTPPTHAAFARPPAGRPSSDPHSPAALAPPASAAASQFHSPLPNPKDEELLSDQEGFETSYEALHGHSGADARTSGNRSGGMTGSELYDGQTFDEGLGETEGSEGTEGSSLEALDREQSPAQRWRRWSLNLDAAATQSRPSQTNASLPRARSANGLRLASFGPSTASLGAHSILSPGIVDDAAYANGLRRPFLPYGDDCADATLRRTQGRSQGRTGADRRGLDRTGGESVRGSVHGGADVPGRTKDSMAGTPDIITSLSMNLSSKKKVVDGVVDVLSRIHMPVSIVAAGILGMASLASVLDLLRLRFAPVSVVLNLTLFAVSVAQLLMILDHTPRSRQIVYEWARVFNSPGGLGTLQCLVGSAGYSQQYSTGMSQIGGLVTCVAAALGILQTVPTLCAMTVSQLRILSILADSERPKGFSNPLRGADVRGADGRLSPRKKSSPRRTNAERFREDKTGAEGRGSESERDRELSGVGGEGKEGREEGSASFVHRALKTAQRFNPFASTGRGGHFNLRLSIPGRNPRANRAPSFLDFSRLSQTRSREELTDEGLSQQPSEGLSEGLTEEASEGVGPDGESYDSIKDQYSSRLSQPSVLSSVPDTRERSVLPDLGPLPSEAGQGLATLPIGRSEKGGRVGGRAKGERTGGSPATPNILIPAVIEETRRGSGPERDRISLINEGQHSAAVKETRFPQQDGRRRFGSSASMQSSLQSLDLEYLERHKQIDKLYLAL